MKLFNVVISQSSIKVLYLIFSDFQNKPMLPEMFAKLTMLLTFIFILQNLSAQPVPRFELSDSAIIDLPKDQKRTFGYLVVYEDQLKKGGKTIRLPVFILKSRSPSPKPDPVLYTAGGPGSSSVNTAKYGAYYSYLDDRDLIVFEQRGTLYAQPNLSCPELDSLKKTNTWINLSDAKREAAQVEAATRCQDRLIGAGNELSSYNSKASAEDIEDLRKVLGIKQFNIYAVSYSTKIAQVLLRDYPTSIRSAVLDSPLPLWANYDETSLHFFNEKLNLLFEACVSDSACSATYPDLKRKFLSFLESANRNPVAVQLKSPIDSSLITVLLKGYQIASFINLGETYSLKGLPKLLHSLCSGDYQVLKPFIYNLFSNDNRSMGMRLSVWCSEEYPFENLSTSSKTNIPAQYAGMKSSAVPLAICKIWKIERAKEIENKAFSTKVPVLLVNGEFDPDTPTIWGQKLQKTFSNSYHFIFKGMSHTPTQNWDNGCGMQLAQSFFNDPLKRPEVKCFTELKRIEFDIKTDKK